jgi:hypothetical protein
MRKSSCFSSVFLLSFCLHAAVSADTLSPKPIAAQPGNRPDKMTKIVFRNITPGLDLSSYEALPVTVYLYKGSYIRVEEQPDKLQGLHGLMILRKSESWAINRMDNTATYYVLEADWWDMSIPLIPQTARDKRFEGLNYGQEISFFGTASAPSAQTMNGINVQRFNTKKEGIEFELLCKLQPTRPYRLKISAKDQTLFQYSFDEYEELPADLKLFDVPSNIKVRLVFPPNPSEELLQNVREKNLPAQANLVKIKSQAKLWCLACSGILWERNGDNFTTLAGQQVSAKSIAERKKFLSQWWGIKNRNDLYENMMELTEGGGRRGEFEYLVKNIIPLDEAKRQDFLREHSEAPNLPAKLKFVKETLEKNGTQSIPAWDYCRAICLCRWGYSCGYISQQEAWFFITQCATELQKSFSSWENMGKNYMIGLSFWDQRYSQSEGELYEQALQRLLENPSSPWRQLPWNTTLEELTSITANDPNQ